MDFLSYKSQILALANETSAIDVMWLYGSQADGSAHAGSDVDLAVCFNVWIDDPLERRLRPELLALEWQKSLGLGEGVISVVDINQAPIGLAMSVLNYSTILACKNDMRKMREQQRIMSMWETDLLYHQKHCSQEYLSTELSDKGLNNESYTLSMKQHMLVLKDELEALSAIHNNRSLNQFEYRAAERTLQILIEACIGIAKHWSYGLSKVAPTDTYSAFERLTMLGEYISNVKWRHIIGMRNALVHDYLNIDPLIVRTVI